MHPVELREAVTSPGGTTTRAIRELEQAGVRAAFLNAINAAMERSKELARGAMAEAEFTVVDDPEPARGRRDAARGGRAPRWPHRPDRRRSPARAYERAAQLEPDWSRVQLWWGDERCVPPERRALELRLAKATLLDRLDREPDVHRIRGELQPADARRASTTARSTE